MAAVEKEDQRFFSFCLEGSRCGFSCAIDGFCSFKDVCGGVKASYCCICYCIFLLFFNCIFIFAIVFFFVLLCFMFIYTSAFPDIHALAEKVYWCEITYCVNM